MTNQTLCASLRYFPALAAAAVLCLSLSVQAAPEPARSADDFVDRIGVATHWGYGDTPYGYAYDQIKKLLGDSGIRHVRDSYHERLPDLYKTYGIKATLIYGPGMPPASAVAQLKNNLPLVDMIEGPNEVDIFASSANYQAKTFPAGPIAFQNDLYAAVKADPATKTLGVIAPSTATSGGNLKLAPLLSEDYVVMHSYAGGAPPETSLIGGFVPNTLNAERILGTNAVLKPIVVTESGYHTALNSGGGVIAGVQPGVSEAAQAKYLPRHFANYFNAGIVRTFTYEFCDEFDHEDTNAEASFGIIRHNLTPKPAYAAMKNLLALLSESRWDAAAQQWQRKPFAPRALDFALTADTDAFPKLRHTLLQKSNGDFDLLIWQEVSSFDTAHRQDITNPPVTVTLTLDMPVAEAASYLPGRSAAAQQTWHGLKTLTLSVPDEVLVVRLTPKSPARPAVLPPLAGVRSAATGTTVTLSLPPAQGRVKGYFVSRLGQYLGRAAGTTFTDTRLQPATGYPYEVCSYDVAGNISTPLKIVAMTRNDLPDLTVTDISWTPASLRAGDQIQFQAAIKNIGVGPTPSGIVHGVAFFVDGTLISWSDTFQGPLAPGESKTLIANNGPKGTALWTATVGPHTITAQVDDVNRITESNEDNNTRKKDSTIVPAP